MYRTGHKDRMFTTEVTGGDGVEAARMVWICGPHAEASHLPRRCEKCMTMDSMTASGLDRQDCYVIVGCFAWNVPRATQTAGPVAIKEQNKLT